MATNNPNSGGVRHQQATGSYAFNEADLAYVRRKRKIEEEDHTGTELNIVPYLDILINLIMFLLVSQAALVSLGVIDVSAPSYSPPGPSNTPPPDPGEGANLKLTLGVAKLGFYIAAKGGVLPGEKPAAEGELTQDGVTRREPTIPLKPNGKYDYAALTRKLRSIKTVFPKAARVYLAADSNIPYNVVVKTLDASRKDAKGELFPAVAFSRVN